MLAQPLRAFSRVRCVATSPHTANTHIQVAAIARIQHQRYQSIPTPARTQCRHFSISTLLATDGSRTNAVKDVQQQNADPEESDLDRAISQEKEKQTRAPWHREGSNVPPVARQRSAGKLLTTPSHLLKLVVPLTTIDQNSDRKDVQPLALLVHPKQPLSYLERLIQSELPSIKAERGAEKVPAVHFRAEDSAQDEITPKKKTSGENVGDGPELSKSDGKAEEARKVARGDGSVERYSGLGREGPDVENGGDRNFVRWSSSTEVGDFIRDAARGKEFAIEIEGASKEIRIAVPSFNDRTFYLRQRLRKTSRKIADMADIKRECDLAAHKSAQRVAMGGAGLLVGYWYLVYRLTFETDLGWDTMEPVTYLVGLSTLICGYLWFLYHNREVSYRSALNLTISRRQTKLYQSKGFDHQRWESLIEDGNALRREIKQVASEYDVEWDETLDEKDEKVTEALKRDRVEKKKQRDNKKKKEDDEEED
ncbi:MAG: hypothetical protein LQ342_005715 [Letrouitia transgressa]|nr:MAG: hypothetical protein LQ342_005715 [Letrouitia transgressa]